MVADFSTMPRLFTNRSRYKAAVAKLMTSVSADAQDRFALWGQWLCRRVYFVSAEGPIAIQHNRGRDKQGQAASRCAACVSFFVA
ncbi:hypothetical protein CSC82_01105 [Rhodobacteraceae bacterium 4F10]|nr:hypothetical protein CSC82_01105 [Rhodobacteraceae bacterium 4F10]